MPFGDLTGKTFDNLYVEKFDHQDSKSRLNYYQCKCKCGKTIIARGIFLKRGVIASCGCPVEKTEYNEPTPVAITVGQKVSLDPFRDMTGFASDMNRGRRVRGVVVYVNEPHKWFSVEYGKRKQRISFNFCDLGHGVQVVK